MSEAHSNTKLNDDAVKFVTRVANFTTVEEYVEELMECKEVDEIDAINLAYSNYDGLETVESLIHLARSICQKHGLNTG